MSETIPPAAASSPSPLLTAVAAAGMIGSLYGSFLYAPTDAFQGDVQRLFYLHVPAALTMYVAITLVFVASLLYLQTRDARWDEVAAAGGEVGLMFGTVVMITGPMWARPIWGAWWVWQDARLVSFFVVWLIFIAYVMLRSYGGSPEQVARFCAVLAILAFVGMPITHYSVRWFRTMHPEPVVMTEGGVGAGLVNAPEMLTTFAVGLLAALLLFAVIFTLRLRIERQSRRVLEMRRHLDIVESTQGTSDP